MIGVIADQADHDVVNEFFELFKTPWEFYRKGHPYDVVLCCKDGAGQIVDASFVIAYTSRQTTADIRNAVTREDSSEHPRILSYRGDRIPIYGHSVTFPGEQDLLLTDESCGESAIQIDQCPEARGFRIGYDLFDEIRTLLTKGQPAECAGMPTLELHIALLRDLITGNGISLMEIPPVPEGYRFVACLTHDVDHPSIRRHKWDHTAFGFLYRAVFGSLRHLVCGRMSVGGLVSNWWAALKLPFVYLGLAKDFWREFDDRYLELEKELRSTFFVIPFKNCPGDNSQGPAPNFRGAQYCAADISDAIRKLMSAGCEIGVHGIDAWLDSARGRAEFEEIRRLTGLSEIGVRMHWLYYDQLSPVALEQAEAAYDSTIGYNETVGYRAGTMQAYKPLQAARLLELPLHAMDTALFYPAYLGLSPRQATTVLGQLVDNAVQFGGCLTINWHDRSIAPERLWDACYRDLVLDLKSGGAWFSTASEAVSWFQKRRSVVFETDSVESDAVQARVSAHIGGDLPGLRLRIYKPRELHRIGAYGSEEYVDTRIDCVTRC